MALMQRSKNRRAMSEINVVPFIDVMLVLLVIFMITTPLLTPGVKVALPETKAQALPKNQQRPLVVTVDATGNYYVNIASKPDRAISAQDLSQLVTQELNKDLNTVEQRPVLVRGDKNVNYGKVVAAMVLLQQAGAKSVGLITQPEAEGKNS